MVEKTRVAEYHRIRAEGLNPELCPTCKTYSLWPKPRQVMNALSRRDNDTYICNPCGREEALTDFAARK